MLVVAPTQNWAWQLRRFVTPPPPVERCELCGAVIPSAHPHLVEIAARRLLCACRACATTLDHEGGALRRVPDRVHGVPGFSLSDAEWDALQIPIGLAFLYRSTPLDRAVALYPGPAGAIESLLPIDGWSHIVARSPALARITPDVEALLVNRQQGEGQYYLVPIDRCFALVGLIRRHWRGLSGGAEAWRAIDAFFDALRLETAASHG